MVSLSQLREASQRQRKLYTQQMDILLPFYRSTNGVIIPVRGQASRLVPNESTDHGLNLAHTCNLFYSAQSVNYLVPRRDGTIILGGAARKCRHDALTEIRNGLTLLMIRP
ncbi:hypothetical protein BJ170DRAFT_485725 [Xylariales sp. AK1849]|nr:hypothetical protein BJ170DRAFT_485725 [Xylariales sp. AK1849]